MAKVRKWLFGRLGRRLGKLLEQIALGTFFFRASWVLAAIMTCVVHVPRFAVVMQIGFQPFVDHALFELLVEYREADFDTAEEVPVHPVRAGEVDVVFQIIAKIENTGMFEKTDRKSVV